MNQTLFEKAINDYPEDFEQFWREYPRRPGNPKRAAFTQWRARRKIGAPAERMIEGAKRYRLYCEATGSIDTPFVMMARTFLGPDMHFLEDWEAPESEPEWAKLPRDDDDLWDFAKAHGFPNPGSLNYYQYRRLLEDEIEKRKKETPHRSRASHG